MDHVGLTLNEYVTNTYEELFQDGILLACDRGRRLGQRTCFERLYFPNGRCISTISFQAVYPAANCPVTLCYLESTGCLRLDTWSGRKRGNLPVAGRFGLASIHSYDEGQPASPQYAATIPGTDANNWVVLLACAQSRYAGECPYR